jgi:6-phosphogluconolactonase
VSRPADLQVLDDPGRAAADLLAAAAAGGGQIALTGGSTPRSAYERAAVADVQWSRATLWWGDERCVQADDELSNYAMARASLLDAIAGPPPEVHRMRGELGPHEGAAAYEAELHEVFGAGMPELDLVLLGMGADGHCASLFPNQPAVEEDVRLVVGVERAGVEPCVPRISLTLPVINAAREVVFLVTGQDKASAVARAFEAEPGPDTPASLVTPASGRLIALLDRPAATGLGQPG